MRIRMKDIVADPELAAKCGLYKETAGTARRFLFAQQGGIQILASMMSAKVAMTRIKTRISGKPRSLMPACRAMGIL